MSPSVLLIDLKTKALEWVECDLSIYNQVNKVDKHLRDTKVLSEVQPIYMYAGKWLKETAELDCLTTALIVYKVPLKPVSVYESMSNLYSEQFDYMVNVLGFDNIPQVMLCIHLSQGDLEQAIHLYLYPQE